MEDASSPEANYLVLDIETKQDPTARALAGGGKGWRIGLESFLRSRSSPRDCERMSGIMSNWSRERARKSTICFSASTRSSALIQRVRSSSRTTVQAMIWESYAEERPATGCSICPYSNISSKPITSISCVATPGQRRTDSRRCGMRVPVWASQPITALSQPMPSTRACHRARRKPMWSRPFCSCFSNSP